MTTYIDGWKLAKREDGENYISHGPLVDNTLFVERRNVYGNDLIYPVNHEARLFAELTGHKTLTKETLNIAKKLGFSIQLAEKDI